MEFIEEKWGNFTRHHVKDKANGAYMIVVPEFGAALHTLQFPSQKGDIKIISETDSPTDFFNARVMYPSSKLSPFPSRLRNGTYTFQGKTYHLPLNDFSGKHAIHGLIAGAGFERQANTEEDTLTYHYQFPGEEGYPFSFEIRIIYKLSKQGLSITTRYKNTGNSSLPLGDGWHPYLRFPESIDQYFLSFTPVAKMELDKDLLPTGKLLSTFPAFRGSEKKMVISIKDLKLDDVFLIEPETGRHEVQLFNDELTVTVWQETGPKKYNYLVLYTPDSRDGIAVEPLTCGPDMLNTGAAMIVLKPGEVHELMMGITLK